MAHAGNDPTVAAGALQAPSTPSPESELPLALSIRALSLGQPSFIDSGDVERVRAPTGAGTSRWPSATTPIGRGVYLNVMPACIPGVDEPLLPRPQRPGVRRR